MHTLLALFGTYTRAIKILFFFTLGLFLTGALVSFSPLDPSMNKATSNYPTNWFGYAGAYVADPILQMVGAGASVVLLMCVVLSLRNLFRNDHGSVWIKILCGMVGMLAVSGMAALIPPKEAWPFYVGMGGMLGDIMKNHLMPLLTPYGYLATLTAISLPCLFVALGMWLSELVIGYNTLRFVAAKSRKALVWIARASLNLLRMMMRQEPLQKNEPDGLDSFVDEEDADNENEPEKESPIVELKETRPLRKKREAKQQSFKLDPSEYEFPDMALLAEPDTTKKNSMTPKSLEQNAKMLKKVLEDFGIKGEILKVRPGPVVTLYELEPAAGTKSSRVIGLADDIARSMSAVSARISVIPGRNVLGIELPNVHRETVYLRELMEREEYRDERIKLPIALGKDIGGEPVMADLARMPHVLIAGTTGSGKSVAVNAMILSYLYRLSPEECRFIMIDPKMLELSVYEGIPHLLAPVVTEPKKAIVALKWAVREMEDRYRLMSNLGVRNIGGYNKRIEEAVEKGQTLERTVQTGFNSETGEPIFETQPLKMEKLPFIVVIVDEMADLMLTAGKEIEGFIQRLAQMARAAGIHMVMATQRPSVDVITGVIKANFPTRISFQVTSRIDSRTILGEMGAEQLLGMGDMLYMAGGGRITRVHGPFVDDKEVDKVVNHLKAQGKPNYVEDITRDDEEEDMLGEEGGGDDLYKQAVAIVRRDKKASTSYIQRQLKIGYNRAANLIEQMEQEGVVSQANHAGKREVLAA